MLFLPDESDHKPIMVTMRRKIGQRPLETLGRPSADLEAPDQSFRNEIIVDEVVDFQQKQNCDGINANRQRVAFSSSNQHRQGKRNQRRKAVSAQEAPPQQERSPP